MLCPLSQHLQRFVCPTPQFAASAFARPCWLTDRQNRKCDIRTVIDPMSSYVHKKKVCNENAGPDGAERERHKYNDKRPREATKSLDTCSLSQHSRQPVPNPTICGIGIQNTLLRTPKRKPETWNAFNRWIDQMIHPVGNSVHKNPPAPACKGHQGCGVRYSALFNY